MATIWPVDLCKAFRTMPYPLKTKLRREIKSNMPEVIEESEVLSSSNSLIKGELTNQIRFETEHDEISGS